MTGKPTREYVRWAAIVIAGSIGLYTLILSGWTLVQIASESRPAGALVFVLIGVLLVPLPLLLIAHGFLKRRYEVAVNVSAAMAAIIVFCFLMNAEHQLHLIKWAERLGGLGEGRHPEAGGMFVGAVAGFALASMGLFLPIICAQTIYRLCRKLGCRWFSLPPASAERHVV